MKRGIAGGSAVMMTLAIMSLSVLTKEIEIIPDKLIFSERKNQEEVEAELDQYFKDLTIQLQKRDSQLRGPQYVYKYEYLAEL